MHSTVSELLQSYGYLLLFVLVGAESLGIPLPGETALVSAAVLTDICARRGAYGHVCSVKCGRIEAVVCADAPPVEEEVLWQSESMMCIEQYRWFGSRPPAAPPGSPSRLVVPPPRLYIS